MNPEVAVLASVGIVSASTDLARRQVPNWLTLASAVAGLAVHTANGGWRGLGFAAAGTAVGFLALWPFNLKGAMGGGDVKLMAAFGAMLGPAGVLKAALLGAIFGGVWVAVWLIARPRVAQVPYAPAIVLGVWASWLGGR
jgi:prepilin peptidase CpaA